MQTTGRTYIEVLERRNVKYEKKSFLIFRWYKKVCSDRIGIDIIINTSEHINDVYINAERLSRYNIETTDHVPEGAEADYEDYSGATEGDR